MVLVTLLVWAGTLWVLLRLRGRVSQVQRLGLFSSVFYAWGLLLDEPFKSPSGASGKVLVGSMLATCLILRVAYTSSLTSHLVVQGKSPTINSLEEMVRRRDSEGWQWGTKSFSGAFNSLLSTSNNPAFHVVKNEMQIVDSEEGIRRVLEEGFSYIRAYYIMRILMETLYTGEKGDNPFHISTTKYPLFAGNTWAFRPGTPFIRSFDDAITRLLDSGLVAHWMEDVIGTYLTQQRRQKKSTMDPKLLVASNTGESGSSDSNTVVLGLLHMQATFLMVGMGVAAATATFLAEHSLHLYRSLSSSSNNN